MNYSKTIIRQQKAVKNIDSAASNYVYALLLACYKSNLNSPEFFDNYRALENTDAIIEAVYNDATTKVFDVSAPKGTLKDINKCSYPFLLSIVAHYVYKYQQQALAEFAIGRMMNIVYEETSI